MIKSILISPIKRNLLTKKMFRVAKEMSETKGKKLMVIGDPCSGNYFQFMSSLFPNCEHGDVTVDLYGCDECNRMDINDMSAWEEFDDGEFVVMETGVLGFSKDIGAVLSQIRGSLEETSFLREGTGAFFGRCSFTRPTVRSSFTRWTHSTHVWMIITQGFCWVERAPFA